MAHSVVEVDTFSSDVTVPDGGDARTAASVQVPFGQLANRTKNLRKGVPGIATSYTLKFPPRVTGNDNARFGHLSSSYQAIFQVDVTDAGSIQIPVDLPALGTITSVTVHLGSIAGHSGVPATKPRMRLFATIPSGSSGYVAGVDVTDPSGSVGTYEADHSISATGLSIPINSAAYYHVEVNGEAGTNSLANLLRVYGVTITVAP